MYSNDLLENYSKAISRLKEFAAIRLLEEGSDIEDLQFIYQDGQLFSLEDPVRGKEFRFVIDFEAKDAEGSPIISLSAELMEIKI